MWCAAEATAAAWWWRSSGPRDGPSWSWSATRRAQELCERFGPEVPLVPGDATEDEPLRAAGIERAQ